MRYPSDTKNNPFFESKRLIRKVKARKYQKNKREKSLNEILLVCGRENRYSIRNDGLGIAIYIKYEGRKKWYRDENFVVIGDALKYIHECLACEE